MERWLWFLLIAACCYFAYDYGRRTERELPLQAELAVYRDRDQLRDELRKEREGSAKAIADAVARVATQRDRERAEAVASTLRDCPVPADLERLRVDRDAATNQRIDAAYRGAGEAP